MTTVVQRARVRLGALGQEAVAGWVDARRALSLLTRLPVSVEWDLAQPWGKLAGWFPFAGLVIGLLLVLLALAWRAVADPTLVGGALVLAAWVGLTGGLHLDGAGDCFDAFYAPVSRERRLEIMKDPHIGSFGVTGLVVLLLLKFAGITAILASAAGATGFWPPLRALWPLVVAPVVARGVMTGILALRGLPLARPGGMGARAREGLGRAQVDGAVATAVIVALLGEWRGLYMLAAAAAAGAAVVALARRRIGGITGDVLGAAVEAAEAAALAAATLICIK
jgi:adenosylcobinamide-GDP ribazoletransferase